MRPLARLCLLLAAGCSGGGGSGAGAPPEPGVLARLSEANLRTHLAAIAGIGPRFVGTPGEEAARDYVVRKLREFGYDVELRPFGYARWEPVSLSVSLRTEEGDVLPVDAVSLGFSPSTPPEGLTAETVYVGDGREDYDRFPPEELFGKIHLVDASDDNLGHRTLTYINAQVRGAAAFVHMKKVRGERGRPLVEVGSTHGFATIPAVAADADARDVLIARAGRPMTIRAVNKKERRNAFNVRGVLPGRSEDGFVAIGAHLDSWYVGESAADNGAGLAAMLELARTLAEDYDRERTVHALAWSAEELGVQGSIAYAAQNLLEIGLGCRLYGNFDILGVAGGQAELTASPPELEARALSYAEEIGFEARTGSPVVIPDVPSLGSDNIPFFVMGIPTLHLLKSPNLYYHTRYDTADRIDFRSMRHELAVVGQLVAEEAGATLREP